MSLEINASQITFSLNYNALINKLRCEFRASYYTVPERQNYTLPNENTSLIMPAWNEEYYGVKQIIACPRNSERDLPTIRGKYDLFDARNGTHLAEIDAAKLTAVRTAATSVLASSFFTKDPGKLVIIGDGVIAQHLKEAYESFYELQETVIWSRSQQASIDLKKEVQNADIISCATHAYSPVLKGVWLKGSTHIDLVGSYKPDMREADDEVIQMAEVYVDDWPTLEESGDLAIPLANGTLARSDVRGTLFNLCSGDVRHEPSGRPTLFKSAGHALEDLVAAIHFYELYR